MLLLTNGVLPECILPCCHDNGIYLKLPWQHDVSKECNYKIYKDLLYRIHGCICVAHRNYGVLWSGIYLVIPHQVSKTDYSYTTSRQGICRLYNSKTLDVRC